ncbi:MAG: sarcosine oxidase subunit gamma [Hyphomicrobiaceae bacterium]
MSDARNTGRDAWSEVAKPGRHGRQSGPARVGCRLYPDPLLAIVSPRKSHETLLSAIVHTHVGVGLPTGPKVAIGQNGQRIAGIGPNRWLAVATGTSPAARTLITDLDVHAHVVDQSHGLALLALDGPDARDTLAKGTGMDLHPRTFSPGDAATTAIAHMTVHIWQTSPAPVFELAVPAGTLGSFWHWLETAAGASGLEATAGETSA